jgi:hypothetical protein
LFVTALLKFEYLCQRHQAGIAETNPMNTPIPKPNTYLPTNVIEIGEVSGPILKPFIQLNA